MNTEMLIGSSFVKGTEAAETILNPKTEETILQLPEASPDQVNWAVDAATRAFATWSRTTPGERAALILKLADKIEAEAEAFATLEALNCGKPRYAVLRDELPAIVDCFRFFAGACRTQHGAVAGEYLAGHTSMIRRDPIGVVASIAPWNYPLMMAAWKIAPAIAAGNTVVIKPSEQTPLTALKLARIIADVLPEGVVNVVVGRGASVGQALIDHPGVSMISLTGDIATGRKVLAAATASIKRTHLELGGKAPVIVFDDADIDAVVEGVKIFGFYNAGQDCTAACRIYANKKIYDKLVGDLTSAVSSLKYARANDDENDIGPLISGRQRARVASFVERAIENGHVQITTGGKLATGKGFFYEPTVVAGAAADGRDRAAGGVRAGGLGDAVLGCRRGRPLGERLALRARVVGVVARHRQGDGSRGAAPIRLHVGQLPLHARQRNAARGHEAVGLRQGPQQLCPGRLHSRAARDGQIRLKRLDLGLANR